MGYSLSYNPYMVMMAMDELFDIKMGQLRDQGTTSYTATYREAFVEEPLRGNIRTFKEVRQAEPVGMAERKPTKQPTGEKLYDTLKPTITREPWN